MLLQIGVKALIKNSLGKYLLLQRSTPMESETIVSWDIPGGRIEPNEALIDALKREVREEVGLKEIPDPQLIAAQDIFVKSKDLHVVRLTYRVICDIKTVKLSDEHSDYRWVGVKEVKNMNVEPYLKEVLTSLM